MGDHAEILHTAEPTPASGEASRGASRFWVTFAALALAALGYSLLQSMVAPALPRMQRALHTSTTSVTWVFTAYLLSASVATPIAGRMGDMFGKRRVLLIVLAALAAGTVICGLASSVGLLVVGRVLQGLGAGVYPVAFGIVRDEFPTEEAATGNALISAILGVGGGLGIVLAGPIVELLGIGMGFAFASMTNLVVRAVDPDQTGQATGINTVTRAIGGAIGGAVFASILSSNVVRGAPSGHGFTVSFTIGAVAIGVAAVAALAVPGRTRAHDAEIERSD